MIFLTSYGEQHRLLYSSQKWLCPQCNTSQQIQTIIATFKDARLTLKDIYLTYIGFKNVFGSIDHARLLAIINDFGYHLGAIGIIGNIY